jgi:predicted Rossmann fold flavoprotein
MLDDPWDSSEIRAGAVIIATGGMSYPATGSTGDGYGWAREAGHSIADLRPALVPLESPCEWVHGLAGLALKNVKASLWADEADDATVSGDSADTAKPRKLAAFQGEMLFTHFGLSGPIILSLSRHFPTDARTNVRVLIDLKPALSAEVLDKRLLRDFQKFQKKQLANAMVELLPKALIPAVILCAGLDGALPVAETTRGQRLKLVETLKSLPVEISGTRPIEEAIITVGGVTLTEMEPRTMASKKVAGLYFAGEILDIDGLTGGYNLQAAFSTGWAAGEGAAKWIAGEGDTKRTADASTAR